VIEVGPKVRNYAVGDVVIRPRSGLPEGSPYSETFGAFCQYGLVTDAWAKAEDAGEDPIAAAAHQQTTAPPNYDPVDLTQTITLKETLSFMRSMGVDSSDSVLIFGTGPVGVSYSLWAEHIGCKTIIIVGRRRQSLQRAMALGHATHTIDNTTENVADRVMEITGGVGATKVIEAIGDEAVLADALASCAEQGAVGIYGIPPTTQDTSPLRRDPRVVAAKVSEASVDREVLDLVAAGTIPGKDLVSHALPASEAMHAFELLAAREAFKVLLRLDQW
jgi:L-iditol 2-dehydrogenase